MGVIKYLLQEEIHKWKFLASFEIPDPPEKNKIFVIEKLLWIDEHKSDSIWQNKKAVSKLYNSLQPHGL